jgi:hypothetical protein
MVTVDVTKLTRCSKYPECFVQKTEIKQGIIFQRVISAWHLHVNRNPRSGSWVANS